MGGTMNITLSLTEAQAERVAVALEQYISRTEVTQDMTGKPWAQAHLILAQQVEAKLRTKRDKYHNAKLARSLSRMGFTS